MVSILQDQIFSNPHQQEQLLRIAAQMIGRDPAVLQQAIQSGQLDAVLSGLPGDRKQQALQLLQDPQALYRMLESPQVQTLLRQLLGR